MAKTKKDLEKEITELKLFRNKVEKTVKAIAGEVCGEYYYHIEKFCQETGLEVPTQIIAITVKAPMHVGKDFIEVIDREGNELEILSSYEKE